MVSMLLSIINQVPQIAGSENGQLKPLTQICTFKLLKPCRSISDEVTLTEMLVESSFNMTM
jgi:hypothetical protein